MKQNHLSRWLKLVIAGVAICGLIIYILIVPMIGKEMVSADAEALSGYYMPWLIFIVVSGIPCYIALAFAWQIAKNIGLNCSFSVENASKLKWISNLAVIDAAYFFAGNVILFLLGMNHPGILLFSLIIVFIGVAISVAAASLSHLVLKGVELEDLNEGTI
ncbi:MAG: DUF2975 domain-containing protein [Eubacteriales bacterium]|nr:DUF2975 domain-containing protein [Eubacteriales bacterium]